MEHDDVAVAVEPDVELDAVGAGGARHLEREHRVLGRVRRVAAVGPHARPAARSGASASARPSRPRCGSSRASGDFGIAARYSTNVLCSARTRLSTCGRSHHSVTRSGDTLTALSGTPAPTALARALLMMPGLPPMPWPTIVTAPSSPNSICVAEHVVEALADVAPVGHVGDREPRAQLLALEVEVRERDRRRLEDLQAVLDGGAAGDARSRISGSGR